MEYTIIPIVDERGKVIYFESIGRDITERRKQAEEIKRLYLMMRQILEKAPFGIYVVNEEGGIDYVNPAMLEISGDRYGEFKSLNVFELPSYREIGLSDRIKACFQGRSFSLKNVEYTSYFGKKYTIRNFIGIPIEEEGEKKVLVFVEDVTERKRMEKELERKINVLERFQKVAVGRELRMIELKKIIKTLREKMRRHEV